jgi:hypothetical protein
MIAPSEGIEDFGNYNECDVDGMGAADIVGGNARLTFFVWVKTSGVYRRHISLIMPARLGALGGCPMRLIRAIVRWLRARFRF